MKKCVLMAILAWGFTANAQYFGVPVDKTLHGLGGVAITGVSYHAIKEFHKGDTQKAFWYSQLTNVLLCTFKEFYDENINDANGGHWDNKDLAVGIGAGLITGTTLNIWDHQMAKRAKREQQRRERISAPTITNGVLTNNSNN